MYVKRTSRGWESEKDNEHVLLYVFDVIKNYINMETFVSIVVELLNNLITVFQ